MKKLLIAVLVAGLAGWYFVGDRKLSEQQVSAFYAELQRATLERKPDAICALLAEEFRSEATITVGTVTRTDENDKSHTCDAYRNLYATWETLGEKMGGLLQLDANHTVHSISISPDGQSATVDISTSLDVAGSLMSMRSRSTDTLVRRKGKVVMLRSVGVGSLGSGS